MSRIGISVSDQSLCSLKQLQITVFIVGFLKTLECSRVYARLVQETRLADCLVTMSEDQDLLARIGKLSGKFFPTTLSLVTHGPRSYQSTQDTEISNTARSIIRI